MNFKLSIPYRFYFCYKRALWPLFFKLFLYLLFQRLARICMLPMLYLFDNICKCSKALEFCFVVPHEVKNFKAIFITFFGSLTESICYSAFLAKQRIESVTWKVRLFSGPFFEKRKWEQMCIIMHLLEWMFYCNVFCVAKRESLINCKGNL